MIEEESILKKNHLQQEAKRNSRRKEGQMTK